MKRIPLKAFLLLSQYVIFYNRCNFVNAKALYGLTVRQAGSTEFPFIVAITSINNNRNEEENVLCTGSLLTRQDVLSAAHCMRNRHLNNTQVIVGSIDVRRGKKFKIIGWMTFDTWATYRNIELIFDSNDVAMIRLHKKVSSSIALGVLTNKTCADCYGLNAITAGWGNIINDNSPRLMHAAHLIVLNNNECISRLSNLYGYIMLVDISLLCSFADPFTLLLSGDSGGPLLYMNTIIGINRSTCPFPNIEVHPEKLNIHTCIYYYQEFITNAINTPNSNRS